MFLHVDAARVWGGTLGKSIRAADSKMFDELTMTTKKLFGTTPDSLQSATLYWPRLKGPQDPTSFGVVLVFKAPYDRAQLKAGFEQLFPKDFKVALHAPSDRVALCLVALGEEYSKPIAAGKTGPLTPAIREAASGKHLLVASSSYSIRQCSQSVPRACMTRPPHGRSAGRGSVRGSV